MPQQARPSLPTTEYPPVSREVSNANTVKILREYAEILEDFIEDLIDNPPAPAVKLTPKQRYIWFLEKIAETYQGDVFSMQAEIAVLLDETLVDRIKDAIQGAMQGLPVEMPMLPASPPFRNYVPGMLLGLRVFQRLFIRLHKQYGPEAG